jgi:hypothetical protein
MPSSGGRYSIPAIFPHAHEHEINKTTEASCESGVMSKKKYIMHHVISTHAADVVA